MSTPTSPAMLSDFDLHLFSEGNHFRTYEKLGAHPAERDGVKGTHFAVWAPNATYVAVIGEFNGWDRGKHPMTLRGAGIWEAFVPGAGQGTVYKYAIDSRYNGYKVDKADPYAFASELRPKTGSIVWDLGRYQWRDAAWMAARAGKQSPDAPVSIYEVHLGSWMRDPGAHGAWLTYRDLAPKLAEYAKAHGYTHVELLPIGEHPFDGSWGYQVTGYFSPTSRFGTPDDFRYLVDTLHQAGVGVFLDWVPAHFPKDEHALVYFDGTHLYEHADVRKGFHPQWNTAIFNYGRTEVANFLISNALFWLDQYHIDGLRVDAVASMLYLDFGREGGEWVPNQFGGRENLEAVAFIRRFNEQVHLNFPGVVTIAEESTAWPGVTKPPAEQGLGFDYKWNMGWMHDMLDYMKLDPIARAHHHQKLTFSRMYAYSEKFVLSFSHDEVVHLKKAMLTKMPGDDWQRFASLRLLYSYWATHPGKKLLFMGQDFGQWREWNHDFSLDWHLLQSPPHQQLLQCVSDLNRLYRDRPELHELDHEEEGFDWLSCDDAEQSVIGFVRYGKDPDAAVVVLCNFTPVVRADYRFGVPWGGEWEEIFNSDAPEYGGSGVGNAGRREAEAVPLHGREFSLPLTLPPLGCLMLTARRPAPAPEEQADTAQGEAKGTKKAAKTAAQAAPALAPSDGARVAGAAKSASEPKAGAEPKPATESKPPAAQAGAKPAKAPKAGARKPPSKKKP